MLDEVQRGVAPSRMETLAPARTQVYSNPVGSQTFDGVRFAAYSDDHPPPHVHGSYAGIRVIVDLFVQERMIRLSERDDSVKPRNAKRSDVQHVLNTARKNFDKLVKLLEEAN